MFREHRTECREVQVSQFSHRAVSGKGRLRSCRPWFPTNTSLHKHLFCEGTRRRRNDGKRRNPKLRVGLGTIRSRRDERAGRRNFTTVNRALSIKGRHRYCRLLSSERSRHDCAVAKNSNEDRISALCFTACPQTGVLRSSDDTLCNFARGLSPQRRWEHAPLCVRCEADLYTWERVA